MSDIKKDESLIPNKNIEKFVEILQKEPSEEALAAALSAVRRSMKAGGRFIVPVKAPDGTGLDIEALSVDGSKWLPVYTSFEEELKGGGSVMSTFLADIGDVLNMAMTQDDIDGVILNPYDRTLKLDKHLIRIILGTMQ